MKSEPVIQATGVWKRYGLPLRPYLRRQVDRLRGQYKEDREAYGPWALRDICFAVERGESLGIVGKNGAGKSTLLKLIAGVSPVTFGGIRVSGRMFPMIELGAGIHHDLTGRENIKLLGAIMGFTQRQIETKLPEVEDFAELGEWLDKPVWQYSSGMRTRLGFSVAVNVEADILLIDEVLAVGDVNFQKKCLNRMDKLANSGVTIVFVTHNPYAIERLCQRALYIHEGEIVAEGSPKDILTAYFHGVMDRSSTIGHNAKARSEKRGGTGAFRITDIAMVDPVDKREISSFMVGESVCFRLTLAVHEPSPRYGFVLRIVDPAGTVVSSVTVRVSAQPALSLQQDCVLECRIDNVNLLPGQYWLDASAYELSGPIIDSVSFAYSFDVVASLEVLESQDKHGMIYLPARWNLVNGMAEAAPNQATEQAQNTT